MKYKFPASMNLDYTPLKKYIKKNQELTKAQLLDKCTGQIDLELLQSIKEIEFSVMGKDNKEDLYLV